MTDTYYTDSKGRRCIDKAPGDSLDYSINIADWGAPIGATITSAPTITVDPALTKVTQGNDASSVAVFVSGGIAGQKLPITFRIPITGPRVLEKTIWINVVATR